MKKFFAGVILCIAVVPILDGCSDMGSEATLIVHSPPPPTAEISFQNNIQPIFQTYGCNGCHGGSGGLFIQTVAQLLKGGDHGPAIVPGKADSSIIIKKLLSPPPFGQRMPQGGSALPDSTTNIIRGWINQGAKNN